jgi:hypothetical protein
MEATNGEVIFDSNRRALLPQQLQKQIISDLERFEYEPLDQNRPCIRLLRLLGNWEEPDLPACEIFHVDNWLQSPTKHPYEALSYCWGSTNTDMTAIVNGRALRITANLYGALHYLKTRGSGRTLWIDAICIDQNNLSERAHQVGLMGEIFSYADRVIFWVGNPDADSDLAMQFLEETELQASRGAKRKLTWDQLDAQTFSIKRSYDKLLMRPWFYRVWVVQEVAKAKSAVFACGIHSVQVETFRDTFEAKEGGFYIHPVLELAPGANGRTVHKMNLYSTLQYFGDHLATDERDKIFALLGLVAPDKGKDFNVRPDYTKSESDIVKETFFYFGSPEEKERGEAPSLVSELIYGLRNCRWRHLEAYYSSTDPDEYERLAYLQYSGP